MNILSNFLSIIFALQYTYIHYFGGCYLQLCTVPVDKHQAGLEAGHHRHSLGEKLT